MVLFDRALALTIVAAVGLLLSMGPLAVAGTDERLGLEARVACQKVIEDFRWQHRIWPSENSDRKPEREAVLPSARIRQQVRDNLEREAWLESRHGIRLGNAVLQDEIDRMARGTRMPERLQALFGALDNDARLIGECLARPALVDRHYERLGGTDAGKPAPDAGSAGNAAGTLASSASQPLSLPTIQSGSGAGDVDAWRVEDYPDGRFSHSAVWTGAEMIVWGGRDDDNISVNTGASYNPTIAPPMVGATILSPIPGRQSALTVRPMAERLTAWCGTAAK